MHVCKGFQLLVRCQRKDVVSYNQFSINLIDWGTPRITSLIGVIIILKAESFVTCNFNLWSHNAEVDILIEKYPVCCFIWSWVLLWYPVEARITSCKWLTWGIELWYFDVIRKCFILYLRHNRGTVLVGCIIMRRQVIMIISPF